MTANPNNFRTATVRVISTDKKETFVGSVLLNPGKTWSVAVSFPEPGILVDMLLYGTTRQSLCEEFSLRTGWRMIWGQGMEEDREDYRLYEEDRLHVLAEVSKYPL